MPGTFNFSLLQFAFASRQFSGPRLKCRFPIAQVAFDLFQFALGEHELFTHSFEIGIVVGQSVRGRICFSATFGFPGCLPSLEIMLIGGM